MMISVFFRLFLFVVLVGGFAAPHVSFAQESDDETQSVRARMDELVEALSENEQAHFYALTGSHNLISVVEIVQEDVANAVKACGDNNPDLKDALKARHKEWVAALKPILKDARGNVDNMIIAQDYMKSREIKSFLKFLDKTREKKNSDIDKIPVTSPEACEYLREKMDETQDNLTQLLRSTLVSLPQSLENASDEEDAGEAE